MKVFKKTRGAERATTDLPVEMPKSAIWGWLELGCAITLSSAVLISMLQLLLAAGNILE